MMHTMFRVAIVDDEEDLLYSLKIILAAEGWDVAVYTDASSALDDFRSGMPDIIIMDSMMPGKDGIWLCRKVRELEKTVPIIFLSAKVEELDKIAGLESGADDYLGKPFSSRELIARIRVQKRRLELTAEKTSVGNQIISGGGFSLGKKSMKISYLTQQLPVTLSEYRVLEYLMRRPEVICTRDELLRAVYREDFCVGDRVIDNHIKRLRNKLQQLSGRTDTFIETIYGVGYRWSTHEN